MSGLRGGAGEWGAVCVVWRGVGREGTGRDGRGRETALLLQRRLDQIKSNTRPEAQLLLLIRLIPSWEIPARIMSGLFFSFFFFLLMNVVRSL